MPIPKDKKLYDKATRAMVKKYSKPSAYRSGAIISLYKELGGEFIEDGKEKKLKRWFKEDWKDVNPDKTDKSYPVYRPTRRVNKDTPLTVDEIDPKNLKKQAKLKQKIKGDANLPPFTAKEEADGYKELIGGSVQQLVKDTVKDLKELNRVAKRKAKNTVATITTKRQAGVLPPAMRKLLSQVGDERIDSLVVIRCPLDFFTKSLLSLVSFGEFQNAIKKAKYDKMFHLALFINNKYILDKQEVLKLVVGNPIKSGCEKLDVDLKRQNISLSEFINKAKMLMGDQLFTSYNSRYNNCQDFIIACLKSNDLLTPDLEQFIKQDADAVFEKMPSISEKIANFLTDTGAVANKLLEGQGNKTKVRNKYRSIRYLTSGHGIKVLDSDDNEIIIKIVKKDKEDKEEPTDQRAQATGWKAFVSERLKGQKMGNISNVNVRIRELAKEWREMKKDAK